MNKSAGASSINNWFGGTPSPQYIPLADVGFGPLQPVMPQALPPSSHFFSNPTWNKMLNLPGVQTIYNKTRAGVAF
jgi:hypothetical protein